MIDKLSRLEPVPLREVWPHEANHFTKWLAEPDNLQLLGESVNMSIELVKRESRVGRFSLDILARDGDSGDNIIIENQLEKTNHDHLGKLITYGSGYDAKTIIWIVEDVWPEHKTAMEWLNANSAEGISFFLVKVEAYRIDNSAPAPKFEVVVAPDNWSKEIRRSISGDGSLSPLRQKQSNFWKGFKQYVKDTNQDFTVSAPPADNYCRSGLGTGEASLAVKMIEKDKCLRCNIFFEQRHINLYDFTEQYSEDIKQKLGNDVIWKPTLHGAIMSKTLKVKDVFDANKYPEYFAWMTENIILFKSVFKEYHEKYQEEGDVEGADGEGTE